MLYPLLLKPVYKDYIWGGDRIINTFLRDVPPGIYAESWEVSDRKDGMSIIENGSLKGSSLHEILFEHKISLLGKDSHFDSFPLLIKIIDAQQNLSVQVHPDDNSAKTYGGEAKTESWVVLDTNQDAIFYAGFNQFYPKDAILKKLPSREILSMLRTLHAKNGDVIFIPGGRLHAIGAGNMVFEVQQNSNTTYRVYDFERGRPLHMKEAQSVTHFDDISDPIIPALILEKTPNYTRTQLIRCPYFVIEKWEIYRSISWEKLENKMEVLFFIEGETSLAPLGRSILLPAQCTPVDIPTQGVTLLRVYLP